MTSVFLHRFVQVMCWWSFNLAFDVCVSVCELRTASHSEHSQLKKSDFMVILLIYLFASLAVYHPHTGYSNRSRCSSTSSSVASPSLLETPPPPVQTQSAPSETRPPPNKQVSWKAFVSSPQHLSRSLTVNSLHRFSKATGVLSRDKGITLVLNDITAVPTMTKMLGALTTATRATAAPHSTLTTQKVLPAPQPPSTTKTDPLRTGCPKGLRGRTALDAGNPVLSQTRQLMPSTAPTPPHPTPLTPFNEE